MKRAYGALRNRFTFLSGVVLIAALTAGFAGFSDGDYFLKINRSIDLFGRVYKEIASNYVDEIDPENFMQAGIDGMLGTLDPYTVYIDKEDGDEVDLLTNGKYGGIGITIGQRDGSIEVTTVMDGYSAQRQGIIPGDRILEVDGVKVDGKRPNDVRNLTRGEPGTEVKVAIQREGEPKPIEFALVREEIQVKNITYAEFVRDGIAYIRLERFSRRAGEELRQVIKELKLKSDIRGIILDLRGNPGGLLDAAVEVVSKFVPQGSMIVSTKGRRPEADKKYFSTEEPLVPDAPVVLLADRNSASASEIVAGGLQDLDRAVIVGTRTFGKGLVQTIMPLNYGAQLKITTARYYTPSGRSIQEIDYMHKDKNGVFRTVPDSLRREYKTTHGRKVYEYGGVTPDSLVTPADTGPMVREIYRKSLFFKFANKYLSEHKSPPVTEITDGILDAFKKFLEEAKFDYQEESDLRIKDLKQIAAKSHYSNEVLSDLDLLASALAKEKVRGFERYKDHLKHELSVEFMGRSKGEHGRIEASLQDDTQLETAIAIVKDTTLYKKKIKS